MNDEPPRDDLTRPKRLIPLWAEELPAPHKTASCRLCGQETGYLARFIKSNGAIALRWVCDNCEDYRTTSDLPHSLLGDIPIDEIPLRADFSEQADSDQMRLIQPCAVCPNDADEYHHWAPQAIFPDWPSVGVYLCEKHHREWHDRLRAHGLRWPSELNEP